MTWQTFIPGVPKPQGSKTSGINKRTGKTFVREDNKGTKPWRKRMVEALQDDAGRPRARFDSAVWVRLRFVFVRPKSHAADTLPTSKALGDVDKLTRNVLDALTQAGVIADDKFVVQLRMVEKVYGPNPGVHIEVGPAVTNPFALAGLRLAVPAAAVEAWEPSAADVVAERLRAAQLGLPRGGDCHCTDRCSGYSVCKMLK